MKRTTNIQEDKETNEKNNKYTRRQRNRWKEKQIDKHTNKTNWRIDKETKKSKNIFFPVKHFLVTSCREKPVFGKTVKK
jgi:hypothetical protein